MHERARTPGLALLLMCAAAPGWAQAPAGPEFQASGLPTQFEEDPGVAVFGDGRFVVVWNARPLPLDADVFARRFAADGTPLGPQFLVNTFTTGNVGTYGRPAVDAVAD